MGVEVVVAVDCGVATFIKNKPGGGDPTPVI